MESKSLISLGLFWVLLLACYKETNGERMLLQIADECADMCHMRCDDIRIQPELCMDGCAKCCKICKCAPTADDQDEDCPCYYRLQRSKMSCP
eukprot:TRINITY_DN6737_c0_g1_i2.p1 TRINITY_DN6737_c0_g1~~TRINITY_DN6737_c0_g1_i2.p1  ORF type:complete len:109 (+),score=14.11 TRINITY_DN6737_c0_g1_i2:50-328(+)